MHLNEFLCTYLTINGFTINPIKSKSQLKAIIKGLCNYNQKHLCDFQTEIELIHTNFLGKQIGKPKIDYIFDQNFQGLIAHVTLENGYFTLKIIDNIYPAEIQFNLFLNKKMEDCSIIIDHLSAPARPNDGLGMFDATYSLVYVNKKNHFLSKSDNKKPFYFINQNPDLDNPNIKNSENYAIILNELKNIECSFCNQLAQYTVFCSFPRKTIPICKEHKDSRYLNGKELGANNQEELDIRNSADKHTSIIIQKDDIKYTKNIKA